VILSGSTHLGFWKDDTLLKIFSLRSMWLFTPIKAKNFQENWCVAFELLPHQQPGKVVDMALVHDVFRRVGIPVRKSCGVPGKLCRFPPACHVFAIFLYH
jgi:hypothetical protein